MGQGARGFFVSGLCPFPLNPSPMSWPDFSWLLMPKLDWVQVEVTSWCNAACVYCPRTVYRNNWANRHMSLETFDKIFPIFSKTKLVFLQGWGEPLLHPEFFHLATLAKKAGCRVGLTTNGMLFDGEKLSRLVGLGIDVVAFSLAGSGPENDRVRCGTRLPQVLAAIRGLNAAKTKRGASRPEINVAYMLLKSGLPDLEQLPGVLQGSGVSQVVISTLDFVAAKELEGETLMPGNDQEYEQLNGRLAGLVERGRVSGLKIHYQLKDPSQRQLLCPEKVQRSLFVAADGRVSPCVFTNLPVKQGTYASKGRERPYRRLTFGNVKELPIPAIWRQKAYSNFRRSFFTGKLISLCQNCLKM